MSEFSWFWGLVWARRGETRIQVGNSTLFIENVELIRFWKVWPLERLDRAGRAARWETRGRYVTLLHCCHAALTLARCYTSVTLHWHTVTRDPASGPRPGLTEISEWNQPEPGPGPQNNTLQPGYPGNGEIIQNNTIGPEYKEAWGEYKTSWTAHWDHSLLFVASSFLWLSILNKNKKVEGQTTYLLRIIYISCSCLSVFRDYPNHCVFDTNRIINYLLCIYILFCSLRFLMDYISI